MGRPDVPLTVPVLQIRNRNPLSPSRFLLHLIFTTSALTTPRLQYEEWKFPARNILHFSFVRLCANNPSYPSRRPTHLPPRDRLHSHRCRHLYLFHALLRLLPPRLRHHLRISDGVPARMGKFPVVPCTYSSRCWVGLGSEEWYQGVGCEYGSLGVRE